MLVVDMRRWCCPQRDINFYRIGLGAHAQPMLTQHDALTWAATQLHIVSVSR